MSLPTVVPRRDPILTAMSIEYQNADFVGDKVFPIIESDTRDFKYGALDKLNLFQNVDDTLAKDGEANEVGFGSEKLTGTMRNYGLKTTISREDTADGADFLNVAMDETNVMTRIVALRRELRQATLLYSRLDGAGRSVDGGNWTNYSAGFDDVLSLVRNKNNQALYPYNAAVIPKQVMNYLERHPSLLSVYFDGNTGTKILNADQIAQLFGVKTVLVPDGRVATVKRPAKITDIDGLGRIWGNHLFLLRISDTVPNRMDPGCCYQFRRRWTKGLVGDNMQIRTWHEPKLGIGGSDVVQQEYQSADMVLAPEMGFVFKDVLS